MGWLQIALGLLQLAPEILKVILSVEQVFGAGNGAAKKAVVMSTIEASGAPAALVSKASGLVDSTVASLNQAGVLPKPAAPVPVQ